MEQSRQRLTRFRTQAQIWAILGVLALVWILGGLMVTAIRVQKTTERIGESSLANLLNAADGGLAFAPFCCTGALALALAGLMLWRNNAAARTEMRHIDILRAQAIQAQQRHL